MSETHKAQRDFAHSNNPGFASAESAILLPFGRDSFLKAAAELYDGQRLELDETTDRIVYQLAGTPSPITLIYSGMGGPATANALEMAAGNGAQRVILFGACGGVDPKVAVGDLVIAAGAVRGEGTSRYYASREFPALCAPELTHDLWKEASAAGMRAHCGVVFTTDASYRQGEEIYETYKGLILGVECECATAAVVAARLGLRLGAIHFCTDNVTLSNSEDRQYRGLAEPRVRSSFEQALEVAVKVLTTPAATS